MPRNILAVDDNPNNLEVLHEMLDGSYNLIEAANGWEALALAEEHEAQLVLLDVMLPIIDGYEVCRKMRRIPAMRSARIIMISAKAMPSERQAGLDAGADNYLTKPFDESELFSILRDRGAITECQTAVTAFNSIAGAPQKQCSRYVRTLDLGFRGQSVDSRRPPNGFPLLPGEQPPHDLKS